MLAQPCCYCLSVARRKQINDSFCLQIAKDRSVSMSLLPSPLVDSQYSRRYSRAAMVLCAKGPQHRCSACRQTKSGSQTRTGATTECEADPRERLSQAATSSCIGPRYSRYAFGKDAARAGFIDAEEPSSLKENVRRKPCPGQIGDSASVTTVHARRELTTAGASSRVLMGAKLNLYRPIQVAIADEVRLCTIRI